MRIKVPDGVLVGRTFMIGVSKDAGENWTFVAANSGSLDRGQLKILFPAAADKLRIPAVGNPVLERNPTPS